MRPTPEEIQRARVDAKKLLAGEFVKKPSDAIRVLLAATEPLPEPCIHCENGMVYDDHCPTCEAPTGKPCEVCGGDGIAPSVKP
mgnify:CR=1 FL=1